MAYTTVPKSSAYFTPKLYTGNYSTNAITGVGFQPDLVWMKTRTTAGENHYLFDAIRGVTNYIHSDTTAPQGTNSATLTAFGSDGFTVGANNSVNKSGEPLVSWNWKANGSGSSNTDGSITSTVSANTTSGFSIAQWTGTGSNATIGHGLGVTPKCFIVKKTSGTSAWSVYHESVGNTKFLNLNTSTGATTSSTVWNNTSPTSSVFSVGTADNGNASGATYIGYFFADVKGYSKFGSYTGNGNVDGTFVYTGFKPAWILTLRTDGNYKRLISDNKRNPSNAVNTYLSAEYADGDASGIDLDFLSNGFKLKTTDAQRNASGSPYIYLAFAEEPLVSTNGVPATAR